MKRGKILSQLRKYGTHWKEPCLNLDIKMLPNRLKCWVLWKKCVFTRFFFVSHRSPDQQSLDSNKFYKLEKWNTVPRVGKIMPKIKFLILTSPYLSMKLILELCLGSPPLKWQGKCNFGYDFVMINGKRSLIVA